MTKSLLIASLIAAAGLVACGKTEEPAPAPAPAPAAEPAPAPAPAPAAEPASSSETSSAVVSVEPAASAASQ